MNIESIKLALEKDKKVVFSSDPAGLHYISVDVPSLKVTFTTDTPDYRGKDLENILEDFYAKFYVTHFQIEMHIHKGKKHDKDITLNLMKNSELVKLSKSVKGIMVENKPDIDRIAQLVNFVMNQFYEVNDWKCKAQ